MKNEPVTVIGVGSPFGDDQVGWRVAEALAARIDPARARVLALDRPGTAVLDELAGRSEAVVVDALAAAGEAGAVRRYGTDTLGSDPLIASGHAFGLAESFALGKALGILPPRLGLYLISIDPLDARIPDAPLTARVAAAAQRLVDELAGALEAGAVT